MEKQQIWKGREKDGENRKGQNKMKIKVKIYQ